MPKDLEADRRLVDDVRAILDRTSFTVTRSLHESRVCINLPRRMKDDHLVSVAAFVDDAPAIAADALDRLAYLERTLTLVARSYAIGSATGDELRGLAAVAGGRADVPADSTK